MSLAKFSQALLTGVLVLIPYLVWAESPDAKSVARRPRPVEATECFKDRLPFFNVVAKTSASTLDKVQMLKPACDEFINKPAMREEQTLEEKVYEAGSDSLVFGFFGHGLGAFAKVHGSEKKEAFTARLIEIKKINNPVDRIREVYNLVASAQGRYDDDYLGGINVLTGAFILTETPNNVLGNSERFGTGGVCRDFASLLQWSLLQVARGPGPASEGLGPSDFSSNFVTGTVPGDSGWKDSYGHAWVRVNLPEFSSSGQLAGFQHFDLDTTENPRFAPLFPRRSGVTEQAAVKIQSQCKETLACLALVPSVAERNSKPEHRAGGVAK